MYKSLLLLLALVCAANAATKTFLYTAGTVNTDFLNVSLWTGGLIPVPGDDVVITGGANTGAGIQTLSLATAISLGSLSLDASDVVISLGPITLTVGTLTLGANGAQVAGQQAAGSAIVATTLNKNLGAATTTTSLRSMTLTVTGTATWSGSLTNAQGLTINNPGTWVWKISETDILNEQNAAGFVLNNQAGATMRLEKLDPAEGTKTLAVNGDMTIAGTTVVLTDCVLQAATVNSGNVGQHSITVTGTLQIDGSLYPTENGDVTFAEGSSITAEGAIFFLAYSTGATLQIDTPFEWGNLQLLGFSRVNSEDPINIDGTLSIGGGRIEGTGPITVETLNSDGWDANIAGGDGVHFVGRNVSISQVWSLGNFPKLYLSESAAINVDIAAVVTFGCNSEILPEDNSAVSLTTSATWNANNSACNPGTKVSVPAYFYGQINIPADFSGGDWSGLNFTKGGQFHGNFSSPLTPDTRFGYNSDYTQWTTGLTAPFTIGSNAHFTGGVLPFTGGLFSFLGRSAGNGLGDGIITTWGDTILSADGANIVAGNVWIQAGTFTSGNGNNFTVINAVRSDAKNLNSSSDWKIDNTNFVALGDLTIQSPRVNFVNNGAIHTRPNSNTRITTANGRFQDTSATVGATSGFYNNGNAYLATVNNGFTLDINWWNNGPLYLTRPSGATAATLTTTKTFGTGQQSNLNLNVYSSSSADRIVWNVGGDACVFRGTVNLEFQYTPAANDEIRIITTNTQTCTGLFSTVTASGLPSGHQAVIVYDQFEGAGTNFNVLVCASGNNDCLRRGNRDPSRATTITTTGASTTAGGNTGSSAAFVAPAVFFVVLSIFASLF